MPDVRTSLNDKHHRLLKEEAAREGLHLNKLIAEIRKNHNENNSNKGEKE